MAFEQANAIQGTGFGAAGQAQGNSGFGQALAIQGVGGGTGGGTGSVLQSAGTGAATGFAVGGPWGAAIGAGAGTLQGILSARAASKRQNAKLQSDMHANIAKIHQTAGIEKNKNQYDV